MNDTMEVKPPVKAVLPETVAMMWADADYVEKHILLENAKNALAIIQRECDASYRHVQEARRGAVFMFWLTPIRHLKAAQLLATELNEDGLTESEDAELEIIADKLGFSSGIGSDNILTDEELVTLGTVLEKYKDAIATDAQKIPIPHSGGDYDTNYHPVLDAIQAANQ